MSYPAFPIAAVALAVMAAPAAATDVTTSVMVRYGDLDLSTRTGQERLERRLDRAARSACGMTRIRIGPDVPSSEARRCYEQSKARAHQRLAEVIARENARG